jgi:hypothetical protein
MNIFTPCAERLRELIGDAKRLSGSNPERFHSQRSDLIAGLSQVADMLEGNFVIENDEPVAKPARQVQKPKAAIIKSAKGNLITVDFKKRRVKVSPEKKPH